MGRSTPAISWTSGRAPASSIGTASGSGRRSGSGLPRSSWCCKHSRRGRPHGKSSTRSARCSVKGTTELPDDPALPALAAIRAVGLAAAIPALALDDRPAELTLRGYTPGSRATFEVRAGDRHFALKLYAEDPEPEAELYEALAAVGLVGEGPVRVPPLLARDRSLQVLAIGWLDGPTGRSSSKAGGGGAPESRQRACCGAPRRC